jgi:CRISPR-associated protein Cmx8
MSKKTVNASTPIEISWSLNALPSSQHRAGLAGMVLLVQYLQRKPDRKGICELSVFSTGASLKLDFQGLTELVDEVYDATQGEVRYEKPLKKKDGSELPPIRIDTETVLKKDKPQAKNWYVYPKVEPKGGPLEEWEPLPDDKTMGTYTGKVWIKLWRDMIWTIYRGVPLTRIPYENRAEGQNSGLEEDIWSALTAKKPQPQALKSNLFLGAQEMTADAVCVQDQAKTSFLLHFAPFVIQIYIPRRYKASGGELTMERDGYALAVPDIQDLESFCELFPDDMRRRSLRIEGYIPAGAMIDMPIEAGLCLIHRMRQTLSEREGGRQTMDLVLAFDVFHARKDGNNIRNLGVARVYPNLPIENEHDRLRHTCKNPFFRLQRIKNLFDQKAWYRGFERLFATLSHTLFIPKSGDSVWNAIYFQQDTRFTFEEAKMNIDPESRIQALILLVVKNYLRHKLGNKYDLAYEDIKDTSKEDPNRKEYQEKKQKVGRDAFLAVRARTGTDFTDYFVSTLCSSPQYMSEADYMLLSSRLLTDPDTIRTLTLLALSARS